MCFSDTEDEDNLLTYMGLMVVAVVTVLAVIVLVAFAVFCYAVIY